MLKELINIIFLIFCAMWNFLCYMSSYIYIYMFMYSYVYFFETLMLNAHKVESLMLQESKF